MGNEQQQQLAGGGDGRHSESHGSRQDHHQEAAFGGHYDYDARSTAAAAGNSHPRSGGPRVEGRNGNEDDGGVDEAEDVKTKRPRESSLDSSYDQSRARQSSSQPPQQRQQRQQSEGDSKEEKKRRAFKACAHCRQRKAKCDLGDLNHPRDPPCARCKREGITCTFLPSRRGGRIPFAARKANLEAAAAAAAAAATNGGVTGSTSQQTSTGEQTPKRETSPLPLPPVSSAPPTSTSSGGFQLPPLPDLGLSQRTNAGGSSSHDSGSAASGVPTFYDPATRRNVSPERSIISLRSIDSLNQSRSLSFSETYARSQQQQQRPSAHTSNSASDIVDLTRSGLTSGSFPSRKTSHPDYSPSNIHSNYFSNIQQENFRVLPSMSPPGTTSQPWSTQQSIMAPPSRLGSGGSASHQRSPQSQMTSNSRGGHNLDTTLFQPPRPGSSAPASVGLSGSSHINAASTSASASSNHGVSIPGSNSMSGALSVSALGGPSSNSSSNNASNAPESAVTVTGPPTGGSSVPSGVSPSGESQSSYDSANRPKHGESSSTGSGSNKRRRKGASGSHHHHHHHHDEEDNRIVDPETLAAQKLRNPVDALNLLVLAADSRKDPTARKEKGDGTSPESVHPDGHGTADGEGKAGVGSGEAGQGAMSNKLNPDGTVARVRFNSEPVSSSDESSAPAAPFQLSDFPLVKRAIVNTLELVYYVNLFFSKVHHIFPMVPYHRIPTTEAQLTAFARDELHLTTVFVLIASRLDQGSARQAEIHDKTWEFMRELINDLIFGKDASVGAVEALLLLSENPPRELAGVGSHKDDYADENRMSWMVMGMAVRIGYMLALDQTSLYPSVPKAQDTPEARAAQEKLDRERIAWTYCYLFDRQISIRTGKAFWSRGPGLCFQGTSEISFPSMRVIPGVQDDFAGLIQAFVEITQIMSNAHDILYPSRDRTIALVRVGEYYKYIDEFTRTLNNFRYMWEGKKWDTFPLTECVWITFHYVRLYIYAFAFQAQIQRATGEVSGDATATQASGSGPATKASSVSAMFPRGPMGSPDAKFILEAIDAAADLLRICTDRLHPQGVLQFLPWRYFLYFAYAGVFLLKAVFINAVAPLDRRTIVRLLKRLIVCLACSSKDEQHHAVRYARLLNSLLRTFSRGQDGVGTGAGTPSNRRSPAGSPVTENKDGAEWPLSRAGSPQPLVNQVPPGGATPSSALNQNPANNANSSSTMHFHNNLFAGLQASLGDGPSNQPTSSSSSNPYYSGSASGIFAQTPSSLSYPSAQQSNNTLQSNGNGSAMGSGAAQQGTNPNPNGGNPNHGPQENLAASRILSDSFAPNTAQEEARAADLLADFSLDFGFPPSEQNSAPLDAYSNLLDDTTLNFWAALSSNQGDWPNMTFSSGY